MNTSTRVIELTQGQSATVDSIDYEFLMQWKWFAQKKKTEYGWLWYARRNGGLPPNRTSISMHSVVAQRAGIKASKHYDHIDRDGRNNCRNNLRAGTHSQSMANRKGWGKVSEFKWTYKPTKNDPGWTSRIRAEGKLHYLGYFTTEIEAAAVGAAFAIYFWGDFACFD